MDALLQPARARLAFFMPSPRARLPQGGSPAAELKAAAISRRRQAAALQPWLAPRAAAWAAIVVGVLAPNAATASPQGAASASAEFMGAANASAEFTGAANASAEFTGAVGADHTHRVTIAIFGDSISRGVGADRTLGQEASLEENLDLFGAQAASDQALVLPDGFLILNYQLMEANDFAARDQFAAVQGSEPYSIAARVQQTLGLPVDPLIVAHMGGSYHEGEAQLAAYQNQLTAKGLTSPDLVIVDLGRADFALLPEPAEFSRYLDVFFHKLMQMSPAARLIVTKVPDIAAVQNRPDRIAVRNLLGQDVTCSQVLERTRLAIRTKIIPGADNSAALPLAVSRLHAYNDILAAKVKSLASEGRLAAFVETYDPSVEPEHLDELLSDDCFHANKKGQAMIADRLWPVVQNLLAKTAPELPGKATPPPASLPKPEGHLTPAGNKLWQTYLGTLPLGDLQAECVPQIKWPTAPYRGVVFLIPGFTACSQVYSDITSSLVARGYAVVLPLLPGHGRKWLTGDKGEAIDQLQDLPTSRVDDPNGYHAAYNRFALTMDSIAAEFDGDRVVAGISVGATVAAAMTTARDYLWQRQLIVSPFYQIHPGDPRDLIHLVDAAGELDRSLEDAIPVMHNRIGFGETCEGWRQPQEKPGRQARAGSCQFEVTNALAVNRFGAEVGSLVKPTTIQTQVLAVQDDPAIDTNEVFRSVGWLRHEQLGTDPYTTATRFDNHPDVRVCYLPSDNAVCQANNGKPPEQQDIPCISHPVLFGFDEPHINTYWVAPVAVKMVDFLTDAHFFAADDQRRTSGDPLCAGFPNR